MFLSQQYGPEAISCTCFWQRRNFFFWSMVCTIMAVILLDSLTWRPRERRSGIRVKCSWPFPSDVVSSKEERWARARCEYDTRCLGRAANRQVSDTGPVWEPLWFRKYENKILSCLLRVWTSCREEYYCRSSKDLLNCNAQFGGEQCRPRRTSQEASQCAALLRRSWSFTWRWARPSCT